MPKVKSGPKKKQNGYIMPDPLPKGEILKDVFNKKWVLGSSIGKGGFGEIYSAQEYNGKPNRNNTFPYVIKIEPHSNGPLFVEMHFFMRNAKKADIDVFMSTKKLTSLGMPVYCGSGSHEYDNTKYRFVVMERYDSDIWKLFLENKKVFNPAAVYKVGIQIVDVLEYIHSRGYVHADIKGANILQDLKKKNQVYLVDFGLATHYYTGDTFKPDPKKAHDGTIEYLSRDAHQGVPTRRGDLEILIFNLIQWLGCVLPWEKDIKNPMAVKASKEKYMDDIPLFMKTCFGGGSPPGAILNLLEYLQTLDFNSQIDYNNVRKILKNGLQSVGGTLASPLVFHITNHPSKRQIDTGTPLSGKKKKISRRKLMDSCSEESEEKENVGDDSDDCREQNMSSPVNKAPTKMDTPKRRGPKPKQKKQEEIEEDAVNDSANDSTAGMTAEMKRIREKIKASKKPAKKARTKKLNSEDKFESQSPSSSRSPPRARRMRKLVNYREYSSRNRTTDEEVTDSDDY